jgi:general secretion pathway protein K
MQYRKHRRCHNGGALISALFITAIASVIATAMAVQQQLIIHDSELGMRADQSYLNLQGMQKSAEITVEKYASQFIGAKNMSSRITPLVTKLPDVTVNGMTMSGTIEDEQGKFNINDMVYPANQARFIVLLQAVVQGISLRESNVIAKAITAWMTNNSQDPYYLSLHPPYRSSQTMMANISELRLIAGMTPEIYNALAPYVTALPVVISTTLGQTITKVAPESPININTALPPVFLTLDPNLTLSQAQRLFQCRQDQGDFSDVTTFIAQCGTQVNVKTLNDAVTDSHYFLMHAEGVRGQQVLSLNSLLVTQPEKNNKLNVQVVWQDFS